uniref:cytochrome P450 3A24-like isoform X1 n=1 Tax=Myxine glutinosa TaxID=7769 RepID=UPI0035900510
MALAFLSFLSPTTWVLIITTCVLLAMYSIWPYTIFKKMGVPGPKPLPLFGNFFHYRQGVAQFDEQCRKCYGGMWGVYEGRYPMLMVTDPEIVKTVLVKEFYTLFTNRRNFKMSGILDDALSVVEDDTWKRIRTILSPTFSTGKLKEMVPIIKHYTNILVEHLRQRESQSLDIKRVFGSYSMDVIASAAFSTQVDSLNNENDPFIKNINKLMKFSLLNPLILLILLFPVVVPVLRFFKVSFLSSSILHFFNSNLQRMKKTRSKGKHSGRVDFLQMMIDAQITETVKDEEGTDTPYKSLTDNEIQAQAIIFIIAGTETTANTLSYVAYNLAVHPDIQSKLQEEIDEAFPNKSELTYEGVMQLPYLDMVISETLRKFPIAIRLERVCKDSTELGGLHVPRGMVIGVPLFALHRDPSIWPEPEEFRPERFTKEAKEGRNPYAYLPFGAGPRNCIGMRFALVHMKMGLVALLQEFNIRTTPDTEIPLEIGKVGLLSPKNPIKLKFERRQRHEEVTPHEGEESE